MVKQGEQKRVQDRVVVTERDQAGSLGKLADAVRGQNTGKLVQKPEQPAEEQTEVTKQLLFAGQGKSFFLHTFVRKDGKTTWMTSLPMLWDVFRGKMSVVGPRPLTKKEMDALIQENPRYFYRLRVQAGLTGYAQVYGKKTSVQEDLLKLDLIYIQHFSALMDMKLMLLSLQGESRQ